MSGCPLLQFAIDSEAAGVKGKSKRFPPLTLHAE